MAFTHTLTHSHTLYLSSSPPEERKTKEERKTTESPLPPLPFPSLPFPSPPPSLLQSPHIVFPAASPKTKPQPTPCDFRYFSRRFFVVSSRAAQFARRPIRNILSPPFSPSSCFSPPPVSHSYLSTYSSPR